MPAKLPRIVVYLPEELKTDLERLAKSHYRPVSNMVLTKEMGTSPVLLGRLFFFEFIDPVFNHLRYRLFPLYSNSFQLLSTVL
ncbi:MULTISPECIES: ribbon-helix-helix domain-containing protein, partial [unclassified Microcoleus]|uniref:ribbon-helix-helix domain-containing protein n=1 Tax=unclassified Microcoleus TaxID=2642155 RepID=UPI00403FACC9